ncbi:MAG TPA: class I SAM-dependent methyltransferase [Dehalococcoidia bacterium]|nr:class I SAM-dependent methyltransferase [Dehalococcoidia bacterium]
MEPGEYEAMYLLEDTLWWYRGQRKITQTLFDRFLPRGKPLEILDVGAGTGGQLAQLAQLGRVTAFDYSSLAVGFFKNRANDRVAQASAGAMPFRDASFDLVTMFEVAATLDNETEAAALTEIGRVLRPGGYLFWREPALMFLYGGPHDKATHVYRRYNAGAFSERLRRMGLTPQRLSYDNMLLFPIALARRLASKLLPGNAPPRSDVRAMPEPLNGILAWVLSQEAPLVARSGLPIGLSVLALAKKE